jgi:hypothetical protein
MSTLINHANYQPQPRDMLMAFQKVADLIKQQTGRTPDIFVGASKLYPPKDGKPMDKKAAVAAHEALYGGKGTIVAKDNKVPVFKQVNGAINKDDLGLEAKLAPQEQSLQKSEVEDKPTPAIEELNDPTASIIYGEVETAASEMTDLLDLSQSDGMEDIKDSPLFKAAEQKYEGAMSSLSSRLETLGAKEQYQYLLNKHPAADKMVAEMAAKEGVLPEKFTEIIANGSEHVQASLDVKLDNDGPKISEGLQYLADTDSQYRASLMEPEPADQTIAQLTAKIEALQGEVASMKKTMSKIASQEPIPFLKAWAKNKIDTVITSVQDRAKVDMVKTVGFGRDLAQKAMDKISSTAGLFEQSQLNVGGIAKDLKTMFEFHDNPPVIELGDYTYTNNDDGIITVNHKDRGDVFVVDEDRTPKIGAKFNAADYQQLSGVKEAVAVVAGPAAIAAQVAKDLAVGAVKNAVGDGAQKSAVKL